jgi:Uma2 family endonuclease
MERRAAKLLAKLDIELASRGSHMQTQGPLRIPPFDVPEPDGAVLRRDERAYADRLPGAADALAVIEVADSSLPSDRTTKLELYTRAGIEQYVIVNLRDACLEVHEGPIGTTGAYARQTVLRAGDVLELRTAEAPLAVDVARILP